MTHDNLLINYASCQTKNHWEKNVITTFLEQEIYPEGFTADP